MSEYSYASSKTASLHDVDHSGTLFEQIYPSAETPTVPTIERPKKPVIYYPETLAERKANALKREMARQAIETREHTAYEDINPGVRHLPAIEPLDAVIIGYESWQQDIAIGVEQLALLSLTPDMVKAMTNEDRRRLGKHAEQFLLLLAHRPRILKTFGGDTASHPTFQAIYGEQRREDVLRYADNLIVLKDELLRSPAMHSLIYAAKESQPSPAIRKASVAKDKESSRYLQVYFEENTRGEVKPRTILEAKAR
jgi:hypothetical protein